jgi:hypothetical protein
MMPWRSKRKPDDLPNDETDRCGYFFLSTGQNDPMIPCCKKHDDMYEDKSHGHTQKEVDQLFFACMMHRAGKSFWLRQRARLYYGIVRSLGWMFW